MTGERLEKGGDDAGEKVRGIHEGICVLSSSNLILKAVASH